ncbi:MAG: Protein containing Heat shock protein Hsp20-like protein [Candidatus Moranbacteria bacterium GW2011_GWC1_45_18]|nr:MAG: Protein containing Heat shock protein Hsp20 protein [Candidatus Moranbacteria bacterium GW2011_GWC2_40_12]KKT34179.1 MAG: Protein containing Heat shock protein Hsp20 protein [Candidatus Moranbacteria bacterium GW2011_GWF2_44_10]KKT70841.1 MAG: Protein containing Heat shock protein Hsp20 protein [Candidatus Moranbacteria bacterium GW2011_GWF1_44_4]KKU00609.1 MAG: Protein containing Heat shock protein Hsp20-like protein [Candidatus Moranbacteria bacterium GW2011_GWC1_45_18]OGI24446.1 MAG:
MKEKRSFFERLTGARKIPGEHGQSSYGYGGTTAPVSYGGTNIQPETAPQEDYSIEPTAQEAEAPAEQDESWAGDSEGQLTIDVYQTDNDIVIKSTIAGVKPEDLDVSINNDMVTIRGERKNDEKVEGENYYYQECYWGTFSRSVILPVEVLADKAEAAMKNGILTLRLPKADTTKTKRIQVRGF